jgi:hypothetical protein
MTKDFKRLAKGLALTCAISSAYGLAQATTLTTEAATTSVDVVDTFFGGTLLDVAITPISNESYNGTARTAVYDTGTGLDFYYQFTNNASSLNGIDRFTGYDFSSLGNANAVNVYQTAAAFGIFTAGTEAADYADRSKFGVIGFSFVPNGASKVNPGTSSNIVIVRTDARAYTDGHFGLLDGIGDNAAGFAPVGAVPEASSASMMLLGLGAFALLARRRVTKI